MKVGYIYLVLEYGDHWRHLKIGHFRRELDVDTILDVGLQDFGFQE